MAAAAAGRRMPWLLAAAVFAANAMLSGLRGDIWLAGLEIATAVLAVLAALGTTVGRSAVPFIPPKVEDGPP
jgi:hypothetical protein